MSSLQKCPHLHVDDYQDAPKPDSDGVYHDREHCADCGQWLSRLTRERPSHRLMTMLDGQSAVPPGSGDICTGCGAHRIAAITAVIRGLIACCPECSTLTMGERNTIRQIVAERLAAAPLPGTTRAGTRCAGCDNVGAFGPFDADCLAQGCRLTRGLPHGAGLAAASRAPSALDAGRVRQGGAT